MNSVVPAVCKLCELCPGIAQGSWYLYIPLASFVRVCQVPNERKSCFQKLSKLSLADDILLAVFARKLKQYSDMVRDASLFQCQSSHVLWANSHLPHSCMKICTFHKCLCIVDEILIITLSITCSNLDQNNYEETSQFHFKCSLFQCCWKLYYSLDMDAWN